MSPRGFLWLGGALLVLGWALVFLAYIDILPKSFWLAGVAATLLIVGSGMGFHGLTALVAGSRRDRP